MIQYKAEDERSGCIMVAFSAKPVFNDIRNFLAGRFVGATRDEFFLEELIKLIFCKYELGDTDTTLITDTKLSGMYRNVFNSVLEKYTDIYGNHDNQIELDPVSIKYVDSKLNTLDLYNIERDIIGDAYEIFMGDAIKGQFGQFFTPQNAAEALINIISPSPDQSILDLACGAGGFLVSTLKFWASKYQDFSIAYTNIHGIDKDDYLVRLSKIHLACLAKTSFDIKCHDSIAWNVDNLGPSENAYDVILTNPPFGANIQTGTVETLSKYLLAFKYKKSRNGYFVKTNEINEAVPPQVVFMEQCIRLIKDNGFIGIVVPESMLSSKKYTYVVEYILSTCCVKAAIGMPDDLFKTSGKGGTHTKTCLLVLQKNDSKDNKKTEYPIFMAEAKWCGHDSRGREIPNDDIPQIVQNYKHYHETNTVPNTALGFVVSSADIENGVLAPRAYTFRVSATTQISEEAYTFVTIGELIEQGCIQVATGDEVGKLAYGSGTIPFIRTSDISNWEIKSDPKHLLSEELYDSLSSKQDVQAGDILMVKDGSYLIGTCAMISEYDTRIVYQSHLYKIRVMPNTYDFDRHYLLAALSSDYLKQQISSKTFSQDIINSLGDRLKDLIVPIPKDKEHIKRISDMVNKAIHESIEARELAKAARRDIFC